MHSPNKGKEEEEDKDNASDGTLTPPVQGPNSPLGGGYGDSLQGGDDGDEDKENSNDSEMEE